MKITTKKYLDEYRARIGSEIPRLIERFNFTAAQRDFAYMTKAAAVFSSNIEGNPVDLNSFMNYELNKDKFQMTKEIEEIENLISAYEFARKKELTEDNFLKAHRILSETLLSENKSGKYRKEKVGVFGSGGLVYLAVEPEKVNDEMGSFFFDISFLFSEKLKDEEVFYFASLAHLKFVHIHPFMDGNGRAARLLEKWFLAQRLGEKFWKIPSEEFYKNNQNKYYQTINLGVNFYELNYDSCVDFLELLPQCLKL